MTSTFPRLHAITNDEVLASRRFLERAQAIAAGPEVAIHLRGSVSARALLELAETLRELTAANGSKLFVNDRADVACMMGADGVHLPAAGLAVSAARTAFPAAGWIGRSTHSVRSVRAALAEGADYVMLGPIWATTSHPHPHPHPGRPHLGPDILGETTPARVIAIGGITPGRTARCVAAGAYGVAAIRALWSAADPAATVREFLLSLGR